MQNYCSVYLFISRETATFGEQESVISSRLSVQTSVITKTNINKLKVELLPRAPYSPDLTPSDYFLFVNLKKLHGSKSKTFANNEEVEYVVDGHSEELDGIEAVEHNSESVWK